MRARFTLMLAAAAIIAVAFAASMPQFVEAGPASGLRFQFQNSPTSRKYLTEAMCGGGAFFDYDNDGLPDVLFLNGAELHDPQANHQPPEESAPELPHRLLLNYCDCT